MSLINNDIVKIVTCKTIDDIGQPKRISLVNSIVCNNFLNKIDILDDLYIIDTIFKDISYISCNVKNLYLERSESINIHQILKFLPKLESITIIEHPYDDKEINWECTNIDEKRRIFLILKNIKSTSRCTHFLIKEL